MERRTKVQSASVAVVKALVAYVLAILAISYIFNFVRINNEVKSIIIDIKKARFEKCIGDYPTDGVCDSCYQLIFKNDTINHYK